MMERQVHTWTATLQRSDGQIVEVPIQTYWSPKKEGASDYVLNAAKGIEGAALAKMNIGCQPIAATLNS